VRSCGVFVRLEGLEPPNLKSSPLKLGS
jgi:hypothetical protein